MRIAIGADHAGFELKEHLRERLVASGHEVEDFGTDSLESTDYPDYAHRVAAAVAAGGADRGLLVCGTGAGMAMGANRHHGVRAVNCTEPFTARLARAHNDANVLALGARLVAPALAEEILNVFLSAPFDGGRHQRRIGKIEDGERG